MIKNSEVLFYICFGLYFTKIFQAISFARATIANIALD